MSIFQLSINPGLAVLALLATSPNLAAQEVPYDISDRDTLNSILSDAKTHLTSHDDVLTWLMSAGIASHQLAVLKVKGASDDAVRYLKKATELAPDDAMLLAYLGSAYAMAGRDSSFVINKISNVNKGLNYLDKAVKKDPKNLTIRLIRAGVAYKLPSMFSRKSTAENDYLFYVNKAKTGTTVDSLRLAEVYFALGKIAEEDERQADAQHFYAQAQKAAPQSDWARQAGSALK